MGIIRSSLRTVGIILIVVGILAGFIPVIGLLLSIPLVIVGIVLFIITKHPIKSEPLYRKINLTRGSIRQVQLLIAIDFVLLLFGPMRLRSTCLIALIILFVWYNKLQNQRWLSDNKITNPHIRKLTSDPIGRGGLGAIVGSTFAFMIMNWGSGKVVNEGAEIIILLGVVKLFFGLLILGGLLTGFWLLRISFRKRCGQGNFKVIKPGEVVISKKKIKRK